MTPAELMTLAASDLVDGAKPDFNKIAPLGLRVMLSDPFWKLALKHGLIRYVLVLYYYFNIAFTLVNALFLLTLQKLSRRWLIGWGIGLRNESKVKGSTPNWANSPQTSLGRLLLHSLKFTHRLVVPCKLATTNNNNTSVLILKLCFWGTNCVSLIQAERLSRHLNVSFHCE